MKFFAAFPWIIIYLQLPSPQGVAMEDASIQKEPSPQPQLPPTRLARAKNEQLRIFRDIFAYRASSTVASKPKSA